MKKFYALLAFYCGIFLSFQVKSFEPMSLGVPVASLACGCYFLLANYLASASGSISSSLLKTGIRLSFIVVALFCLLSVVSPFRKERPIARQKSCLANLRVIAAALEDYNMNASGPNRISSMEMKDVASGGLLLRAGILRSEIIGLTEKCQYHGSDLTGNGTLICDYHGSADHPSELPDTTPPIPGKIANIAGMFFFVMAMLYLPIVMISQFFGKNSHEEKSEN